MRVIINRQSTLGLRTGVGRYTASLLHGLRELAEPGDRLDAFPDGWVWRGRQLLARSDPLFQPRPAAGGWLGRLRPRVPQALKRYGRAALQRHFRDVCRRHGYDLYHEPNFLPLPSDAPTVLTVHDLSVLRHPEWHPRERVEAFGGRFLPAVARCEHFLTGSDFTRAEVIRLLGVSPRRVTRVYYGVRPDLRPLPADRVAAELRTLRLPRRYLLYLGTIEPRKNVLTMLRAYCDLPAALRERCPLVLAGAWGWGAAEVAEFLDRVGRHRNVVYAGYVADELLPALYNGARALVYPSHYEGFGLPPVEMMACGGAVLASTAAALDETVGGQAHLIEPGDVAGWRDGLARVVSDDDWWRRLRRGAVARAARFSWSRCAAETLGVYRRLTEEAEPAVLPYAAPVRARAA
jgi:alpha-1,3-rhamnosyl/mannosyltransferase